MPISQRTATGGTAASSASFSITLPGSTAVGDILIVAVTNAGTTGPAAPAGWTRPYSASAGSGQSHSVYWAQYSAGLTLSFTNAASAAAWVCNAYFQSGYTIRLDPVTNPVATTNTTNNTTLPTGAPTTGPAAGDYEVMTYGHTAAPTIATTASGSTIDLRQANGTSCTAIIAHNNTTSLAANTAVTAFSHTLSASNSRKTGVGILLQPVKFIGTASSDGVASVSATIGKNVPKDIGAVSAAGTATASGEVEERGRLPLAALPADDFGDGTLTPIWEELSFGSSAHPVESGGQLRLSPTPNSAFNTVGVGTVDTYDLTNKAVVVELVQADATNTNAASRLVISDPASGTKYVYLYSEITSGPTRRLSVKIDPSTWRDPWPATLRWLRIEIEAERIFFYWSADGLTWVRHRPTGALYRPSPFTQTTALKIELVAAEGQATASPVTTIWDNLNCAPAGAPLSGQATGGAIVSATLGKTGKRDVVGVATAQANVSATLSKLPLLIGSAAGNATVSVTLEKISRATTLATNLDTAPPEPPWQLYAGGSAEWTTGKIDMFPQAGITVGEFRNWSVYMLAGDRVFFQIQDFVSDGPLGTSARVEVWANEVWWGDYFSIQIYEDTDGIKKLRCYQNTGYTTPIPYDASAHRFLAIRIDATSAYLETSADAAIWSVVASGERSAESRWDRNLGIGVLARQTTGAPGLRVTINGFNTSSLRNLTGAANGVAATSAEITFPLGSHLFVDHFDRVDSDTVGGNWAEGEGDWDIVGNAVYATGGAGQSALLNTSSLGTANYKVVARITGGELSDGSTRGVGVYARRISATEGYLAWADGQAPHIKLYNGPFSVIGTYALGAFPTSFELALKCDGSTISVELDGIEVISVTDTAHTIEGDFGLRTYNALAMPSHRYHYVYVDGVGVAGGVRDISGSASGTSTASGAVDTGAPVEPSVLPPFTALPGSPLTMPGKVLLGAPYEFTAPEPGGDVDISGSAGGVASASATLSRRRALTAASAGVASASTIITRKRSITAASAGVAVTTATIGRKRALTASSAGVASVSATIQRKKALTASSAGVASVSAAISRRRGLSAASAGVATVSVTLRRARALLGASAGVASVSATASRRRALTAASAGVASVSVILGAKRRLVASASAGVATTIGLIGNVRGAIVGSSHGHGTASATLSAYRRLTAAAAGVASASAAIKVRRALLAASAGAASVTAALAARRALTAAANGVAVASAQPGRRRLLVASSAIGVAVASAVIGKRVTNDLPSVLSAGVASTSAVLTRVRGGLSGAAIASGASSALLSARRALQVATHGLATTTALLGSRRGLVALAQGRAATSGQPGRAREILGASHGQATTTGVIDKRLYSEYYPVRPPTTVVGVPGNGIHTSPVTRPSYSTPQNGSSYRTGRNGRSYRVPEVGPSYRSGHR